MDAKDLGYIDQLRGIAILMVIAVHSAQSVPHLAGILSALCGYGQMGVQLFFVASAFTLSRSHMLRAQESNPTAKFYVRRFFRIAPLYYVGVALYFFLNVVVGGLNNGTPPDAYTPMSVLANLIFVHGFVVAANNSIVPGGWSIGTEMAFYVIFPLLFSLCLMMRTKRGPGAVWMLASLTFVLCIVAIAALLHIFHPVFRVNSFLYYNLLSQLPVFMLGIATFLQYEQRSEKLADPGVSLMLFAILTIAAGYFLRSQNSWLLPVTAGMSFVFLLDFLRTVQPAAKLIARIGELSYSMYVFHFVFVWYAVGWVVKRIEFLGPAAMLAIIYLGGVALTFCVALVTEAVIERHGIAVGRAICRRL